MTPDLSKSCRDVLLCECTSIWGDPIDAHTRNSLAMARDLGCDIVGGTCTDNMRTNIPSSYLHCLKKSYNAIVFPYGSNYLNYFHLPKFVRANPHAQLFWFINDYCGTHPFSFLKKQCHILTDEIVLVSSVENDQRADMFQAAVCVNLNLLLAREPNPPAKKQHDIIYYGTFRPKREPYFRRYLREGVTVSCSPKNLTKFHDIGCTARFINKIHWPYQRETLNQFRFSLYIEDPYSHDHYTFLPNRFYESVFCNCVLMVDRNCLPAFKRAGLVVDEDFVVSDHAELMSKTSLLSKDMPSALQRQQAAWLHVILPEREQVLRDLEIVLHKKYPQNNRPKSDRTHVYASPIAVAEPA